jgi:arsenical pump membrane protein
VLASLIGVNLGPNLTYAGSLATLLWRRVLRAHDADASLGEYTRLGLLAVPISLVAARHVTRGVHHALRRCGAARPLRTVLEPCP